MGTTCVCGFSIRHQQLEYDTTITCPACKSPLLIVGANGSKPAEPTPQQTVEQYQEFLNTVHSLWRELHTMHLGDWGTVRERYENWKTRIPSFGCSCNEHFKKMEANYPPDFSSPEAFFRWGWMRHNDVNLRLGKSKFSYEDALRIHTS
jgi:hypothetical protein